jgi:hypothetical protein
MKNGSYFNAPFSQVDEMIGYKNDISHVIDKLTQIIGEHVSFQKNKIVDLKELNYRLMLKRSEEDKKIKRAK